MTTNLDRYKNDLDKLKKNGDLLALTIRYECFPDDFKKSLGEKAEEAIKILPNFRDEYQLWYSEAKALIKQVLPDRLDDFVRHYEKPRARKTLDNENYRIEDYIQGLSVSRAGETLVRLDAAVPHFQSQLAILKSVSARFASSLFDIRQLVQADLFDSELAAASELIK